MIKCGSFSYFTTEGYGWHEDRLDNNKVHIFDVNGSKVKEMVDTFQEVTGLERSPHRVKLQGYGNAHQVNECTPIGNHIGSFVIKQSKNRGIL